MRENERNTSTRNLIMIALATVFINNRPVYVCPSAIVSNYMYINIVTTITCLVMCLIKILIFTTYNASK